LHPRTRGLSPATRIEVLVPDFRGRLERRSTSSSPHHRM
jgi:lipoate synthase